MRVTHQHRASVTINGVTYLNPTWYIENLIFNFHTEYIVVSIFITDDSGKNDLIDVKMTMPSLTESNVVLAVEKWLQGL